MSLHPTIWAAVLVAGISSQAIAQSAEPSIPSPTNPYPANPVATDGSSLAGTLGPSGYAMGRSAYVASVPSSIRVLRSRRKIELNRTLENIDGQ